ncbi:MAG: hypothetical protein COW92_05510 [Candidatus Omnitrophica bacterium CG22_combo_CG10-13_8_21_14_all_43_16]|nr:MAG: hypothetical protein COW92_05510 [Candidatus Omnitrophica bacterium CG22_combo_CG10-13_8_21_14_all_43_16]
MNDIRPLKDVFDIKGAFPGLRFIILILIALAIAAFIYFKKKKIAEAKPILIQKSPEGIAKDALRLLLEMNLIEKGLIKEYYIRLSDIIRAYIENRHKISAMDRTTWELYQEMRSKRIERMRVDNINDFLEDCDMVKFAKYTPDKKEIEDSYKKAAELISITAPKTTA